MIWVLITAAVLRLLSSWVAPRPVVSEFDALFDESNWTEFPEEELPSCTDQPAGQRRLETPPARGSERAEAAAGKPGQRGAFFYGSADLN